jgi:hypothetical protein
MEADEKSNYTGNIYDSKISIHKIKNVFKLLISEMPFLIDKKILA